MPDDNLFPNAKEPDVPTGDSKPNGADTGAGGTPLTVEMGAEMVTQAMAPLADQLKEVGDTLAQMRQTPTPTPTPVPEPPQGDFLTRFSEDPEGAVKSEAQKPVEMIMPLMSNFLNSAVSGWMSLEANKIDTEFGAGAWDEFFSKPMDIIIDNYKATNAAALSDNKVITKETNGLKGVQFNELVDFRDASREAASKAADDSQKVLVDGVLQQIPRTNMTGGLRRVSGGAEEIPEGLEGYLAERARSIGAEPEDPKKWLADKDYGNSISDYREHQKKLAAAEGGK
jgi:hypothetical protein